MDFKSFCYWLQGFFEMRNGGKITKEQAALIEEHLNLTFNKVTPKITEIGDLAEEIKPWKSPPIPPADITPMPWKRDRDDWYGEGRPIMRMSDQNFVEEQPDIDFSVVASC